MGAVTRRYEIRKRRQRKAQQKKLKAKLLKASPAQSAMIMKRITRVMYAAPLREFLTAANRGNVKKAA